MRRVMFSTKGDGARPVDDYGRQFGGCETEGACAAKKLES
jgi:hypothetical protein